MPFATSKKHFFVIKAKDPQKPAHFRTDFFVVNLKV